jgi:hypothetical protein
MSVLNFLLWISYFELLHLGLWSNLAWRIRVELILLHMYTRLLQYHLSLNKCM